MRSLGGIAAASLLLAGCAATSPGMLPAQAPNQYGAPYVPYGAAPPSQAPRQAPEASQLLVVTPVFYLPSDVALDPQQELNMTGLISSHLALARDRYLKILQVDTFRWSVEQPVTYRSRLTSDELEASRPDTAHTMTREILAWRGENRVSSRHVFVALIVRPPGRPCGGASHLRCMGGGRTFNGAPGTGGGFIQLEANNLLDGRRFQSSLIHELGHAFGLSHADCHGQSMHEGASIMSYNKAHWSAGLVESTDPGTFTAEDLVTLARNRLAFPRLAQAPQIQDLARQPLIRANGECYLGPMDASIGSSPPANAYSGYPAAGQPYAPPVAPQAPSAPSGRGYELFYDGRRVSGPEAQFYVRPQAEKHCAAMVRLHPETRVTCTFDGAPVGGTP